MQPRTLETTQMGPHEKASDKSLFSVMNLGLKSAITHITAEIVRTIQQRVGRIPPIAPEMASARILTAIVQLPSNLMGIINRKIPITDGIMNPAFVAFLLFIIPLHVSYYAF